MSYLSEIKMMLQDAPKKSAGYFDIQKYLGTKHTVLGLQSKTMDIITREFKKKYPDLSFDDCISLLNELNTSTIFEEKIIGAGLLWRYKDHRARITPAHLRKWLMNLAGWCEVDCLCQNTFDGPFMLTSWDLWKKSLRAFAANKNISLRRASLVLLCMPLRTSDDPRIADLALENVETLKQEKDILITKAISWVLREMVRNHKELLRTYLDKNDATLPAIARREARKKLETGKKI